MYALRAKRRFLLLRELCGSRPAFSVFNQSSRQAHAIAGDQQRNLDGRHNRMAKEFDRLRETQCDSSTGAVISAISVRVTPPNTSSRARECP